MEYEILLIYFVYGLAFWAMGLAVLLESGRAGSATQGRSLHWLAAFGMLHGTHEWLEAFILAARSLGAAFPPWWEWLRLVLLSVSFGCLLAYALTSLHEAAARNTRLHWGYYLPVAAVLWVLMASSLAYRQAAPPWLPLLDAAARYVLAVPSAALAALAAWASARQEQAETGPAIAENLRLASYGFLGYSLTQLLVHRLPWFPASLINQEAFLSLTGFPIHALRALMAMLISVGLLRAMQAAERHRQAQLDAAHRARLAALEEQDTLRRDLLRHVVRSQEDERARIARELHDEVAQLLSAFSIQLGALRLKLKRPEALESADRLQGLAKQMSQSLFHLVRDLRPSHLDNLGLVPALRFVLSQEYAPKGLEVSFHVTGHARPLHGLIDTALFRVAQESLTNIVRHAGVTRASVDVHFEVDRVRLRICDEGRGFDPAEQFHPPRGWGLAGMRERVEALGGELSLRSGPSQGTTVEAVVPLNSEPGEASGHV
jgi:signal transduction histidine kinase